MNYEKAASFLLLLFQRCAFGSSGFDPLLNPTEAKENQGQEISHFGRIIFQIYDQDPPRYICICCR